MKTYDELKALIDQRGVHAVFGDAGEGWAIEQNAAELAEFLVVCQQLGVESVLEIGTGYKAGLARFLNDDMGWSVVSIDIKDYGHSFSGITFVAGLTANERWQGSLQADLIIIDGDHSYEGVKADYEWYSTWAQKVIAFHDIAGLRDCEGAKQYWDEIAYTDQLSEDRPQDLYMDVKPGYHEIIADGDQRGGIGYIVLSEVAAEPEPPPAKKPAPRKPAAKPTAPKKAPVKK